MLRDVEFGEFILVSIRPQAGNPAVLTRARIAVLQMLFPTLGFSVRGQTSRHLSEGEVIPSEIQISLDKSEVLEGESFKAWVRSLITTLLNDPEGVLGFNSESASTTLLSPSGHTDP